MTADPIRQLIDKMTPDQKVGATITFGMAGSVITPDVIEAVERFHCSGLRLSPIFRRFGSYIDPATGKTLVKIGDAKGFKDGIPATYCDVGPYADILAKLQKIAAGRPLSLPLHFSIDNEGGRMGDLSMGGVTCFTSPMGLTATGDPTCAYHAALATARQMRAVGIHWLHSPVLDVNCNPSNPEIYTRAYSDRAEDVARFAEQSCRGFIDGGAIAAGKHFPGRGACGEDIHFTLTTLDIPRDVMLNRELLPYRVLIEKDLLPSVMLAHTLYPAFDDTDVATVSKPIVTDLLRGELGFNGVITTDSMTMAGIASRYGVAQACAMALAAGADLVLMKAEDTLREEAFNAIKRYVDEGRIDEADLDEKICRILSLKKRYGLFEQFTPADVAVTVRDPEFSKLADDLGEKSVLVARDRESLLPLPCDEPVLVIEQATATPNDSYYHPSMLSEFCHTHNRQAQLLEVDMSADADDRQRIAAAVDRYDTIVITNYYLRSKKPNTDIVEKLIAAGKKVVMITNTPFPISIPDAAGTVVVTFSTTPANLKAVAATIFGKLSPSGKWPVDYRLPA